MKLIIGLGNPGKQYAKTRHNVGFMILDELKKQTAKEKKSLVWELSKKFNAEVAACSFGNKKIILAKPMTFMNDSGQAVGLIMRFYDLKPEDLLVAHDDKDLPLGTIKIQTDRGPAGHNGVHSIVAHVGSQNFTRVRVGIASDNPKKMTDVAKFVLNNFSLLERKKMREVIAEAAKKILALTQ